MLVTVLIDVYIFFSVNKRLLHIIILVYVWLFTVNVVIMFYVLVMYGGIKNCSYSMIKI